ncbi:hypothetical protein ACQB60_30185 [Actinomycetota bacterium Odt1-20B]
MVEIIAKTKEHGCNPRSFSPRHSEHISEEMRAGRWDSDNPDPICLCSHGGCINGIHRLNAAVMAGIPLEAWLATEVPHKVFTKMDTGRRRSPGDALGMTGVVTNRRLIASAVRLTGLYDFRRDVPWTSWGSEYVSNPCITEWYTEHYSDITELRSTAHSLRNHVKACPSASLAAVYLISREAPEGPAEAFFEGVSSGANVAGPRLALRNEILAGTSTRGPRQLGMFIKAWNTFVTGKGRTVKMSIGEPMPDIVPCRHRELKLGA